MAVTSVPPRRLRKRVDDSLLNELAEQMAHAREMSDVTYRLAVSELSGTPGDFARWKEIHGQYLSVVREYKSELERIEALRRDLGAPDWQDAVDEWEARLERIYAPRGDQYLALVATLAPLIVRAEMAQQGQVRLKPGEHTDLARTIASVIAQLQKHTESTKTQTESISRGAMLVLGIVERYVGNQPKIFGEIFDASRKAIEEVSLLEGEYTTLPAAGRLSSNVPTLEEETTS